MHRSICVVSSIEYDGRRCIEGIGRSLSEEDIGKKMVRTMPKRHGTNLDRNVWDWSFTGRTDDQDDTRDRSVLITRLDNENIYYREVRDSLESDSKLEFNEGWNDDKWMVLDDYTEWIANNPLDRFRSRSLGDRKQTNPHADGILHIVIIPELLRCARRVYAADDDEEESPPLPQRKPRPVKQAVIQKAISQVKEKKRPKREERRSNSQKRQFYGCNNK